MGRRWWIATVALVAVLGLDRCGVLDAHGQAPPPPLWHFEAGG